MKIKSLLITIVILLSATTIWAQPPQFPPSQFRKFTNSHNSYMGSQTTFRNGNIIYRDRSGRAVAYGTRNNPRSTLYSNSHGSYMFREIYQNNNKTSTFYNRAGKSVGHSTNQNMRGRR